MRDFACSCSQSVALAFPRQGDHEFTPGMAMVADQKEGFPLCLAGGTNELGYGY